MSTTADQVPPAKEAPVVATKDVVAEAGDKATEVSVSGPDSTSCPNPESFGDSLVQEGSPGEKKSVADSKSGAVSDSSSAKKSPGKRNTPQRVAASLADPDSLMEICVVDEVTKQTQCAIPYQRSTFMVVGALEGASPTTKLGIRTQVWNKMESDNVAAFPRPAFRRIPNFKESAQACNSVAELEIFKNAKTVMIGPDRPQQQIRYLALEQGKTLLVPTSRLATGFLNKISPPAESNSDSLNIRASGEGVRKFSTQVGLDDGVKVDLVILGSVAVSKSGLRLGKGEGFADLEWAMMRSREFVDKDTSVVTCVHDLQVKDELPENIFQPYDMPVDVIVTPTQTIQVRQPLPKPTGLIWQKLTPEKLERCPVLKLLREKEEAEGKDVTLGETPKREIISQIDPENLTDKCVQTFTTARRRFRNSLRRTSGRNRSFDIHAKHQAKLERMKRDRKDRRRGKSAGEEDADKNTEDVVKKAKQRRNQQRRQRSFRGKGSDKENDGDVEKSAGEATGDSAVEDKEADGVTAGKRRPRKKRAPRAVENGNGDAALQRQSGEGQQGGRRRGPPGAGRGNYSMPQNRFAPPWLNQYNSSPPNRYGGYYPPGPMNPGRFFRNPGPPPMRPGYYENQDYYRGPPPRRPANFYPNRRPAVFVGDIPKDVGEDFFADMLEGHKVRPYRMIWQHNENRTFLEFDSLPQARDCVRKLRNLTINDETCRVDLSNITKRTYFE